MLSATHKPNKGTLIPIGGNEDKGLAEDDSHVLDYVKEGILAHVVRESGGPDAKILVVPAASSIPVEVGENYLSAFGTLGCKNVTVMQTKNKLETDTPEHLELLKQADCVMFSGGDQTKISKKIKDTKFHELLLEKYHNEQFVIAGTSAGAMAMANEMIAGGSAKEAFIKGAVRMYKGLALIPELIIDTHFIQRGRFGRITEAVAQFPQLVGLGLAEDTGLIIKNNRFEVIGSGMVIVFDGRRLIHNNHAILDPGTPLSITGLRTHILSNGDRFNIKNKKVEVLPMEASFI
ncbi:cyanophycinase [Subsaximicrobium wynnwilliamsii]|uniref:Cyanophycinase n=1 Tax=Subsaximicrobium wynnwilliamsii TaxID=291179 RepID=A0A5C6ZEN5_9FLAO|nr:cyanophycinase [Subsaximicrobium wynnwilliamsii]TXD82410.1 cyanophycinase [Subsaximicrobium wynnwilliamsii]TXD88052.1 cyanophycinase [Subsaximicrobium wynnwilliamsii]TXE02086.1 cyanophycinase [Subsaximicrobium wynnwilliamsii]